MKTFAPNYYKKFKCIAEKCNHNCCIGWEIDIDDDTLSKYQNDNTNFSKTLMEGIEYHDGYACFKLDGKGRCAFLNENSLCEIILHMGEHSLCQICSDHPRFRNYYSDRIEMGLGLCCEEAAKIILDEDSPFLMEIISDDFCNDTINEYDTAFLQFRNKLFEILNDDNLMLSEKIKVFSSYFEIDFPDLTKDELFDLFISLERLDDHWSVILNQLRETDTSDIVIPDTFDKYFENLIKYYTYRHFTADDSEIVFFIFVSYLMIENICKMHIKNYNELTLNDIVEYCRLYSSEIEYSDENIEKIIDELYKNEP